MGARPERAAGVSMDDLISHLLSPDALTTVTHAVLVLCFGLAAAWLAALGVGSLASRRMGADHGRVIRRVAWLLLAVLAVLSALSQLGVDLGVLLGAAGILTVALGFASQTSASNLISGLFLLAERPFVVGDALRIGATTGEVIAVDLLSVKIRTYDNLFVRIPNETLLKSEITNLTHFPIRRIDLHLGVAYKEDLDQVCEVLLAVAQRNPRMLDEPAPTILFTGFGDSSVNLRLGVWTRREGYVDQVSALHKAVKRALDEAGIEIPFPHRTLYTGAVTAPLPVRLVSAEDEPGRSAPDASPPGDPAC